MLVLYLWITVGPSRFTTAAAAGLADFGLGLLPLPQEAGCSQDRRSIGVGRLLFFDKKLSADGKVSCSKCHAPSSHSPTDAPPISSHRH
jgi:cytochrome c peroxidase